MLIECRIDGRLVGACEIAEYRLRQDAGPYWQDDIDFRLQVVDQELEVFRQKINHYVHHGARVEFTLVVLSKMKTDDKEN